MTTITIHESTKGGEFQTLLEFIQSLDVGELLDFRAESRETLTPSVKASLKAFEKEGSDDCVNL